LSGFWNLDESDNDNNGIWNLENYLLKHSNVFISNYLTTKSKKNGLFYLGTAWS